MDSRTTIAKWKVMALLIALHLASGVFFLLHAWTVSELRMLWLVAAGVLVGLAFSKKPRVIGYCLPALASVSILLTIGVRALPIHSLGWDRIDTVKISRPGQDWVIEVTDPDEVAVFREFGARGSYKCMLKCALYYHIYVGIHDDGGSTWQGYYVHNSAFGRYPGGWAQSIFVPQKQGFVEFFESLLAKYGHPHER